MVREFLESDRQLAVTPIARSEILDRMTESETVLVSGVARIETNLGFYVVTERGIYYAHQEKAGLLKKREVSGFFDKADLHDVNVETSRSHAYLRLHNESGERVGTMWFENEFCDGDAAELANDVANKLIRQDVS